MSTSVGLMKAGPLRDISPMQLAFLANEISLNFNYSYLILAKSNALKKDTFEDLKKTMFTEFNKIK